MDSFNRNCARVARAGSVPIVLALLLTNSVTKAQVATAEVGPNLIQSILNQINNYTQSTQDYSEYGLEAKRWYDKYLHMQQQLIKLQGFTASMGPMTEQFARRAEDYAMTESCHGSDGGLSLAALKQEFGIDLNGDIQEQQVQLCERIVLAENAKYNETVDMLKRLRKRSDELKKIEQGRSNVGDSQGNLEANDNDVARFSAGMQMDLEYWEAMLAGYDSYIGLLRMDQQRLALRAMDGSSKPWGTVIQGAVLKAALETAGTRDR